MLAAEKIAELETKYVDVAKVKYTDGAGKTEMFIFRQPSRGQAKMLLAASRREDADAVEKVIIGLCVSHTRDEMDAFLEEPGHAFAMQTVLNEIQPWLLGKTEQMGKGL